MWLKRYDALNPASSTGWNSIWHIKYESKLSTQFNNGIMERTIIRLACDEWLIFNWNVGFEWLLTNSIGKLWPWIQSIGQVWNFLNQSTTWFTLLWTLGVLPNKYMGPVKVATRDAWPDVEQTKTTLTLKDLFVRSSRKWTFLIVLQWTCQADQSNMKHHENYFKLILPHFHSNPDHSEIWRTLPSESSLLQANDSFEDLEFHT